MEGKSIVRIISSETGEGRDIEFDGSGGGVASLLWSPKATKLIIQDWPEAIGESFGFAVTYKDAPTTFSNQGEGYFVLDMQSGEVKKLEPLRRVDNFIYFIDEERLFIPGLSYDKNRAAIFNLETFEADYDSITEEFRPSGVSQIDTNADTDLWAFSRSFNPAKDSNMVVANIPNIDNGEMIARGTWAELQSPKISPDGTKVAYELHKQPDEANTPRIMVFDRTTGKETFIGFGRGIFWVDDNNMVVDNTWSSTSAIKAFLVNINSKEQTPL